MARRKTTRTQATLGFTRRGGRRPGAGRKPKGERAGVSHATRAALAARFPVHVTTRLFAGLPNLRSKHAFRHLRDCFFEGCDRFGFRLIHFSVQSNHLHFIAEAEDRTSLTRGLQGLLIRIAKRLNKWWVRKGSVFSDRYHDRILRTPREVRNALAYVLNNARKHGVALAAGLLDPFASGAWFDGWRHVAGLATARSWLLRLGWRRHGPLDPDEVPGPRG
jgi:REP element-mobilizing transposase RayT